MDNKEKLHKLFDAVLDANGLEARTKEKTGLKPTVFFSFSGHIAACEIRVIDNGWASGLYECGRGFNFDVDDEIPDEKVEEACDYLEAVSLPKKEEELLRSMIEDKEKSIDKAINELEELREKLAEVKNER